MNRSVASIVCAEQSTFSLCCDGEVYSFGGVIVDEDGIEEVVFPPKVIPSLKNITSICGGVSHCVCLDYDGNVFTLGGNLYGAIGIGVDSNTLRFTPIPQKVNLPPCAQISCGDYFAMCLTNDGFLYSFGSNNKGQLGLGNTQSMNSPQKIEFLKDVEFIECGNNHTFCKTLNNEIYCWGDNNCGQLGLGNNTNQNTPILCSSLSNEDVIDFKCGDEHSLVLTSNGDVLSCGNNRYGQLGREPNDYSSSFQKIEDLFEIIRISCGYDHSMCIDICNDLYIFGNNDYGQLGLGDKNTRDKPIKHPSLSNIIDISKGGFYTFVKTSNNEIYAFGSNDNSQLGIKTEHENQITPIRVLEDNEDIWFSNINKSKAKSARMCSQNNF